MKRALLLAGTLTAVVAIVVLQLPTMHVDEQERAWQRRINHSRRVLAYPVTAQLPLSLALRPDDTELRVVSNLLVAPDALPPIDAPADPAAPTEFPYALSYRFYDANGRAVWASTYWETTRKTRIQDPGEPLPLEEAFVDRRDVVACDARATHLTLRALIERGARRLEITPATADGRAETRTVLVRVLRRRWLDENAAMLRWSRLSEAARNALLGQLDAYGPDLVPERERQAILRRSWEPVPAEPHDGVDHPTVALYLTGLWQSYTPVAETRRHTELAGPHRHVAINIVGPANLWIELRRRPPNTPCPLPVGPVLPPGAAPSFRLMGLQESGVFLSSTRRLEPTGGPFGPMAIQVAVPPGAATVQLEPLNFRCEVRVHADAVRPLDGSEVTRVLGPVGRDGRYLELEPDVATTRLYDAHTTGPDDPPVTAEIVHERGSAVSEIRIVARRRLAPDAPMLPQRVAIEVELLGEADELLARRELVAETEPSRYALAWPAARRPERVTRPIGFRLRCERRVRRIRVRAQQPTLVGFYTRLRRLDRVRRIPEDQPASPEVASSRVASGRLRPPTWYYFRPDNAIRLATLGREVRVRLQRRLFRPRNRRETEAILGGRGVALVPHAVSATARVTRVIVPRIAAGERVAVATAATRWRVAAPGSCRVRVRDLIVPDSPRPVPVELTCVRSNGGAAGDLLLLAWIDGARRQALRLDAPGAHRFVLGVLAPGTHTLRFELFRRAEPSAPFRPTSDGEAGVTIVVNQPIAPRDDADTPRAALPFGNEQRFHTLAPGTRLHFPFRRTATIAGSLSCAWVPEPGPSAIRDVLELQLERADGEPLEQHWVSVARTPSPPTVCLDGTQRPRLYRFPIRLSRDLPPGDYRLSVRLASGRGGLLRVTLLDTAPTLLSAGRFVHLNVLGPLTVRLSVDGRWLQQHDADGVRLAYRLTSREGAGPLQPVRLRRADPEALEASAAIRVPDGVHTVSVGGLGDPVPVRVFSSRPVGGTCGREVLALSPETAELTELELYPARARRRWYATRPGAALRYALPPSPPDRSPPPLAFVVRTELPSPDEEAAPGSVVLAVRCRDREGRTLSESRCRLAPRADDSCVALSAPSSRYAQPDTIYLRPPSATATIELESVSATAWVAARRELDPSPIRTVYTPIDAASTDRPRLRHGARLPHRSNPIEPLGVERLAAAGRARWLATSRPVLEELEPEPPVAGARLPLHPETGAELMRVLQRLGPQPAERWRAGWYTPIEAGRPTRIEIPAAFGAPGTPGDGETQPVLQVRWEGLREPPPESVTLSLDGKRVATVLSLARRGLAQTPLPEAGEHVLLVGGLPPEAKVFVNVPVAGAAQPEAFRYRTLYELASGRPIRLRLEKPPGQDLVLEGSLALASPAEAAGLGALHVRVLAAQTPPGVAVTDPTIRDRIVLPVGGGAQPVLVLHTGRTVETTTHPFAVALKHDVPPGPCVVELRWDGPRETWLHLGLQLPGRPVVERVHRRVIRRAALR